jgi:hypothetical protein
MSQAPFRIAGTRTIRKSLTPPKTTAHEPFLNPRHNRNPRSRPTTASTRQCGHIAVSSSPTESVNRQAIAVSPFASASASNLSDGPLGLFSPRSHCETVVGDTFKW